MRARRGEKRKMEIHPWQEGRGGKRHDRAKNPSPDPVQLYDTQADIGNQNLA